MQEPPTYSTLDEDTAAELELDTTDELLGIELDEDTAAELELGTTEDELLGVELDEDSAAELELDATEEELLNFELDEDISMPELMFGGNPPPLSDEQEKVKAKASPKAAANTILENCALFLINLSQS